MTAWEPQRCDRRWPNRIRNRIHQVFLNGSKRGGTEIASALLESSIFENCQPVTLAGRIGLKAEI
jgi:hypothetical protein